MRTARHADAYFLRILWYVCVCVCLCVCGFTVLIVCVMDPLWSDLNR